MPCASMAETTKKSLSTPKLQKSKLPASPTSLTPQTPAPLRRSGRRASLGLDFSQPACSAQKPINDSSDYRCSVRGSDESDPQAHQVSRVSLHEKNSRNARKRARKDEIRECLDSPSPLKIERNESNRKAQPSGRKKDGMVEVKLDFCPVSPDLVETKKRKLGREGNVTTRSVVTRSAKLEETKSKNKKVKKRVYYKKVAFDGGEFAVGDDVYVKRREDASSDDEIAEEEECRICFKAGNSVMVECDDCLGGFHLKCLKPPLKEIPEGDWICRFCEAWKSGKELEFPKPPEGKKRLRTLREKLLSSDLWAAHIESLWKDIDGSYWFRGRWYIIPEETAVGRQAHTLRRELYRTNDFADIEMESVIRLCSVLSPKDYAKANNEGDDVFLCEYEYDIHWHSFKRIAEIDNNDEEGEDDESDEDWKHCEDDNSDTDGDMEYEEENVQNASRSSQSHTQAANSRKGGFFGLQKIGTKRIPEHVRCHKQTDLERAKATLLLATLPKSLPCRNKEMEEITAFIKGAISDDQCLGRCLYVHGVPGTGKTMSVLAVMRGLRSEVDAGKIRSYCFVEVNGLKLATPENIYKVIYEALSGHRVSWKKALHSLNERFSEGKKIHKEDDRPCILLIDELDLLVTRNQSVLYNILDWPTKLHSKLIVIGIANTMDLPEKLLPRISSRMGIQRLCFGPYNYQQLQEIISSRLRGTDVFEKQAIEFASRKVAAISGDARRALEICRRAAEVADYRSKKQIDSGDSPCNDKVVVGMAEVEAAIQEMFQAPHIQVMKTCSKLGKIFLTAMVYELYTTGMSETTFEKVRILVVPITDPRLSKASALGQQGGGRPPRHGRGKASSMRRAPLACWVIAVLLGPL